jgi:hypothetical protein
VKEVGEEWLNDVPAFSFSFSLFPFFFFFFIYIKRRYHVLAKLDGEQ